MGWVCSFAADHWKKKNVRGRGNGKMQIYTEKASSHELKFISRPERVEEFDVKVSASKPRRIVSISVRVFFRESHSR